MGVPLLVFDFDHTITDLNTDVEVQKLHPAGRIPETSEVHGLYSSLGWTEYMREVFKLLHEEGVSKDSILACMAALEFTPGMEDLLRTSVADYGAKIIIISDSNSVFIEHILQHRGLAHLIDQVYTNPGRWMEGEEEGRLWIEPYHHQTTCDLSTVNLCKGNILEDYVKSQPADAFSFIAYVGDGGNDFCPALRLSPADFVFVREGFSLQKKIPKMKDKGLEIKCQIEYWSTAHQILEKIQIHSRNLKQGCIY